MRVVCEAQATRCGMTGCPLCNSKILARSLRSPVHPTTHSRQHVHGVHRPRPCLSTSKQFNPVLMSAVEALFKFPPFFDMASKNVSNRAPAGMQPALPLATSPHRRVCTLERACWSECTTLYSNALHAKLMVLQARSMIIKRAESIGLDWSGAMRELSAQDWPTRMCAATNPAVRYPSYYTQPFHAYKEVRAHVHATVCGGGGGRAGPRGGGER